MSLESFGVEVTNPECIIEVEGRSFAEFILYLHLHVENLDKAARALEGANPKGDNAMLMGVQRTLSAMCSTSRTALHEHLRLAGEQGLRFGIVSTNVLGH